MLQLSNHTPLQATIVVAADHHAVDSCYVILKGTFSLADRLSLAEPQLPLVEQDEFHGDPQQSSLKAVSELHPPKPSTDVLLVGSAHAAAGSPVAEMEVSLKVGPVAKKVHVFGNRTWETRRPGRRVSEPKPFETMPLTWERAFGGVDPGNGDQSPVSMEDRNPAGTGYRAPNRADPPEGLALPNLEDPDHLISSWTDRPAPAAFAPIAPIWEPRRGYAGTYDQAWQKQRAPFFPEDFDPRFYQVAPPDLVSPEYLQGGEPVELAGASPRGTLRFWLPALKPQVTYLLDDQSHLRPANLDTVLIEPDESRLVMVWRTALACDKKALRIREVVVVLQPSGAED